jgi:rare lipoprotein A
MPGNRALRWLVVLGGLLLLLGCGSTPRETVGQSGLGGHYKLGKPYQVGGRWYYPSYDPGYAVVGVASWYGHPFHGRRTANGEVFDRDQLSAAHPTLPLPSIVRVTNLANQRQLELRVNDRGPFVGERVIDLSQAAARALDFERRGTTPVRVEFVRLADAPGVPPQPTVAQVVPAAAAQPAPDAAPPVRLAVVEPAAAPEASDAAAGLQLAKAPGSQCAAGGFIQVGAFVEADRAVRLAKELAAMVPVPVSAGLPSPDHFTRVRIGPLLDHERAESTLLWLHQLGHANAFLVGQDAMSSVAC